MQVAHTHTHTNTPIVHPGSYHIISYLCLEVFRLIVGGNERHDSGQRTCRYQQRQKETTTGATERSSIFGKDILSIVGAARHVAAGMCVGIGIGIGARHMTASSRRREMVTEVITQKGRGAAMQVLFHIVVQTTAFERFTVVIGHDDSGHVHNGLGVSDHSLPKIKRIESQTKKEQN